VESVLKPSIISLVKLLRKVSMFSFYLCLKSEYPRLSYYFLEVVCDYPCFRFAFLEEMPFNAAVNLNTICWDY